MPSTSQPLAARRSSPRPGRVVHGAQGQTLVEFALIVPVFLFLLMALIEFMFVFNAIIAADYSTRDAALIAAEAGNAADADCVILSKVDEDMAPPVDRAQIKDVWIYRADNVGDPIGGSLDPWTAAETQHYTRSAAGTPLTCGSLSVPYQLASSTYDPADRCNVLNGEACPEDSLGVKRTGVDHIGVRISYLYAPHVPMTMPFLGVMLQLRGDDFYVVKSNVMRMEPVL